MAERRMFAKSIVQSSKFLKMPVSTREFYFQLGMSADDDGVVEAWNVMKLTNAHEDDLRVLVGKGYVTILDNEDLIAYLNDWNSNNSIRSDRYHKGAYKALKLRVLGTTSLHLDCNDDNQVTTKCQPTDNQLTTNCQPNGNQMTTEVRLGKDSIGKDNINNKYAEPDKQVTALSGIELILVDNTMFEVPVSDVEMWEKAFPAVNIKQELFAMNAWLNSNPTKRKTRRGIKRFINSWLSRVQDKGGSRYVPKEKPQKQEEAPPLDYWGDD